MFESDIICKFPIDFCLMIHPVYAMITAMTIGWFTASVYSLYRGIFPLHVTVMAGDDDCFWFLRNFIFSGFMLSVYIFVTFLFLPIMLLIIIIVFIYFLVRLVDEDLHK